MSNSWVIRVTNPETKGYWYVTGFKEGGYFTYGDQLEHAVHFARKEDAQNELDCAHWHSGCYKLHIEIVPSEVKIPESVFKAAYSGPPDMKLRWVKDIAKWVADLFK